MNAKQWYQRRVAITAGGLETLNVANMKCSLSLASIFVCSLILGTECIVWKSCDPNSKGKVTDVQIGGCGSQPICPLHKGTNATFSVTFTMNENSNSATAVVHGIVAGVPVKFPIDNPDGCKNCGLTCPLQTTQQYNYSTYIYVKNEYPSIKLAVKWELQDDNKNDIFCITVAVQIVSGQENSINKWHRL